MPSSHPTSSLYNPTLEEEAYAIYIYEKMFGSFPTNGNLHLDAKTILSAFTVKSGINGLILRSMWSVADPENKKLLTDISQFHIILRLVALMQEGLLEQELNSGFEKTQMTPTAIMQKTLWMSSNYDDCPLPSFKGVPIPSKNFLRELSDKIKGNSAALPASAPVPVPIGAPAPAPYPIPLGAPVPAPMPLPKPAPSPQNAAQQVTGPTNNRQPTDQNDAYDGMQSAIQQIEGLAFNNDKPNLDSLKELDPDNFELLQEQAALQRALLESPNKSGIGHQKAASSKTASVEGGAVASAGPSKSHMSEDEALQRAIYESTYAASPHPMPPSHPAAVAAAPKKKEHSNWLRMSSFGDSSNEVGSPHNDDEDSDEGYKRRRANKGDAAFAEYLASQDPYNALNTPATDAMTKEGKISSNDPGNDKKPAAKKPPAVKPPAPQNPWAGSTLATQKDSNINKPSGMPTQQQDADSRVDEYPQAVQELVMNGFELEKAIQGYKMLGDNFDDIVLFLTSNMTIKELVINGFNIRKVVQAYELIGDNMDDLIAYLMNDSS